MNVSVSTKLAARSLWRNPRRTLLSVLGIGIACSVGLIHIGLTRGEWGLYGRAAAESGIGHLRLAPATWLDKRDPDLRLADWRAELAAARALPNVVVATPRARMQGLLAIGNRIQSVEIAGVDPATEQTALRFVRNVVAGRYLKPDDRGATVIGKTLAERLRVTLDDELVVTAVRKDGEMESALLRVVGIVASGSREIDAGICHVTLPDLEKLSGRAGAGEIAVVLADQKGLEAARAALAAVAAPGDAAVTWMEISPELRAGIEMDGGFARITITVIMLVVLLGVASAQLTAVLERRKEFAVLAALGMKGSRILRALMAEAVFLGAAGALVGLAIGGTIVWHWAAHGLDLRSLMSQEANVVAGVMADPIIFTDFGWWILREAFVLCVGAAVLASLYPAYFASRTDPADALRVAQ
jgi:ABC-type lipoprotein release transport system permease subunit